jgi:hypothetical protein
VEATLRAWHLQSAVWGGADEEGGCSAEEGWCGLLRVVLSGDADGAHGDR